MRASQTRSNPCLAAETWRLLAMVMVVAALVVALVAWSGANDVATGAPYGMAAAGSGGGDSGADDGVAEWGGDPPVDPLVGA